MPRPAVPPCAAPSRCARGMFGIWVRQIRCVGLYVVCSVCFLAEAKAKTSLPGHALHEKGVQRQKNVGPIVSSQERRALLGPRSKHGLCSPTGLHSMSLVRASEETFTTIVFDALEGARVGRLLGEPICRRPGVHIPDPTHLWYVRVLDSASFMTLCVPHCPFGNH